MNCKPGNLCRIVHNMETALAGIADRFVTVVKLDQNALAEPSWLYEGPPLHYGFGFEVQCIPDMWLRPINNPGDDEVDEISLRRGIPEGEIA